MHALRPERFLRIRRTAEAATAVDAPTARGRRRPAPPPPQPAPGGRALSFDFAASADAEDFRCAFYRFVELKSRALVDPRAGCSIAIRRSGPRHVAEVGLWSAKAAGEFGSFWRRYAQVYGRRASLRG